MAELIEFALLCMLALIIGAFLLGLVLGVESNIGGSHVVDPCTTDALRALNDTKWYKSFADFSSVSLISVEPNGGIYLDGGVVRYKYALKDTEGGLHSVLILYSTAHYGNSYTVYIDGKQESVVFG